MIKLAQLVDAPSRAVRKVLEEKVDEPRRQAYGQIAEALFALYEEELYPDATFSLRIAFGRVARGQNSKPFATTIGQAFAHADSHDNAGYWELPESWQSKRIELAKSEAQFNFLSTLDTHGGNSGSPVFNDRLELVGLLFDGTVEGLGRTFMYAGKFGDSVSVHTAGMTEVLRTVYKTDRLLLELGVKSS